MSGPGYHGPTHEVFEHVDGSFESVGTDIIPGIANALNALRSSFHPQHFVVCQKKLGVDIPGDGTLTPIDFHVLSTDSLPLAPGFLTNDVSGQTAYDTVAGDAITYNAAFAGDYFTGYASGDYPFALNRLPGIFTLFIEVFLVVSGGSAYDLAVSYTLETASGSAPETFEYGSFPNDLKFPSIGSGKSSAAIAIPIIERTRSGGPDKFKVWIGQDSGVASDATLGPSQIRLTCVRTNVV